MAKLNAVKVIEEIHEKFGGFYRKGSVFENLFLDFDFQERKFIVSLGGFSSGPCDVSLVDYLNTPQKLSISYAYPYDFYLSVSKKTWTDRWISHACLCGDSDIDEKFTIDVKDISAPPKILSNKIFIEAIKPLLEGLQFLVINNHGIQYATGKYSDHTLDHLSDLITFFDQQTKPS